MDALAVVFERPEEIHLAHLELIKPTQDDVIVEVDYTGISSGTERLLWSGRMPVFPGMGYPLVPGYESVGRVVECGANCGRKVGDYVFVGGSRSFADARALFGGAAQLLIAPGQRVVPIDASLGERGVLLALAATALHAIDGGAVPQLIIGHGVLGRLLARLAVLLGIEPPVVWETNPARHTGARGYRVCNPDDDTRRDYASIYDVSGDGSLLDTLITRLAPGGEIVLAGFYDVLSFQFAPAFQREARLRIAAQWLPGDLATVAKYVSQGKLVLDDLVSHIQAVTDAPSAYRQAFTDAACVKMVLDWRNSA
ncbi:MAG: chlorophyll synthesis pathway protein BchC [Phycisphaerae bacterium]|nr:chlorophyll synthesis pathway protein BchC [Gemmatimonadaceae bacterium]